jgi:hypothetical protein
VTRCKFYECIVNTRLRMHHPTAVFLDPRAAKWKCSKRTRDHDVSIPAGITISRNGGASEPS